MARQSLKYLAFLLGCAVLGLVAALAAIYSWRLDNLPALTTWHTVHLDAEFRAADRNKIRTLADYRALEDRLFGQLKTEIYDRVGAEDQRRFNRYASGSLADPLARRVNWNRTFELPVTNLRGAVLMMHGLSDSPYAMRALAERMHARGYQVVGLRLPGHGTAPSGLVHSGWEDWAAAVRLAARDLAQRVGPGKKLYLAGYSTGAALAVEYALARLQGEPLPAVEGLILMSPAIGVSPAAALAVWQGRLATLLGIPDLAWTDVSPEYDPYKYSSFPVNAADQIHAGTQLIRKRIAELGQSGAVAGMPRILAFQSIADDTVSTPAVIDTLFARLASEGHELVLFDINRHAEAAALYLPGAPAVRENLLQGPALPFELTILTNADAESANIVAVRRKAGSGEIAIEQTALKWPAGVFSLSHVALPISPLDPVYGAKVRKQENLVYLGTLGLLGERGLLAVSPANLIRLRYNPFFDYQAGRAEAFVLASDGGSR
jgi:alpha-beta hydrolase superfamily lysophospholipase